MMWASNQHRYRAAQTSVSPCRAMSWWHPGTEWHDDVVICMVWVGKIPLIMHRIITEHVHVVLVTTRHRHHLHGVATLSLSSTCIVTCKVTFKLNSGLIYHFWKISRRISSRACMICTPTLTEELWSKFCILYTRFYDTFYMATF